MYSSQLLWMRLSLDELSDEISGIPLVESDKGVYRRMGENRDGVGSVEIEIMARRGVCKDEGLYREVEVVSVDCRVKDCILDMRRSDVCWVRRMEDSRLCVRVSGLILLIVFGMILTTMVLLMKRRRRNELRVCDYVEI